MRFLLLWFLTACLWAETDLVFPWVTFNQGFGSKLVINNVGADAADVNLVAMRESGDTATLALSLEAGQQRVLQVCEAFASLGEGAGFSVRLQSANDQLEGAFVVSSLQSASGDSPSQANPQRASDASSTLLFPYMPVRSDNFAAAVLVNPQPDAVNVTFYAYQAGDRVQSAVRALPGGYRPTALLVTDVFPEVSGDVFLVAACDAPVLGSTFYFNAQREPAMANAVAIDQLPDPQTQQADLMLRDAKIYGHEAATGLAIRDGKIVYVGDEAGILPWVGQDTQVIALDGQLLLPGFIDNHNHLGEGGEAWCLPDNENPLAAQAQLLAACAQGVPAGEWVIGYGGAFEIELDPDLNETYPLALLDNIFPAHPIIIMDYTSHAMFVNSLAYAAMGWTAETANPQGGLIMKDENGALNGVLVDNAGDVMMEVAVNSLGNAFDLFRQGIGEGMRLANQNGITSVGDGRTYWRRGMFEAWQAVANAGEMTVRVSLRPWIYPELAREQQLGFLRDAFQNDVTRDLIVNQVKMYSDGVPEYGTGRVIEPYQFTYHADHPHGINYIPLAEMKDWLSALRELGYGAHIHAIGDLGVRETLDAIEAVRGQGSSLKYHMTHLTMVDSVDVGRFASLGVDADFQVPSTTREELAFYIGSTRANQLRLTPIKEVAESGANVVLSSDWTVHPLSPLNAIAYTQEAGALSIEQAIDAYTINPAKALGIDHLTGSIEVGKQADLTVLEQDIRAMAGGAIRDVAVQMTLYSGKLVYQR